MTDNSATEAAAGKADIATAMNVLLMIEHGCDEGFAERTVAQWTAKCTEIASLRERVKCQQVDIAGTIERSRLLFDAKNHWRERAETAERKLAKAMEKLKVYEAWDDQP